MQSQSYVEGDAKRGHQVSARRARERELERKRARGEISCAECRRLKLKCNKKVPCNSCIRRGCHTICPNGLLTTGKGSRFVLANTDKLHSKLLQMSQRIRQLEDALQIAHSSSSKAPHPLLSNDLLSIKSGVDDLTKVDNEKEEDEASGKEDELTMAMGTLTVSECGATRFIGRLAAETLLATEPVVDYNEQTYTNIDTDSDPYQRLPDAVLQAAKSFPFAHTHFSRDELLPSIYQHLPTYERATALVEAYLENASALPRPIERDQIMEDLLPMIYKRKHPEPLNTQPGEEDAKYDGKTRMHNLALVLAVFACGAASDLTLLLDNSEGQLYHVLALAALNMHPVTSPGGASLETVQSMILIAQYDFFSGSKQTFEGAWKTISFALVVATSIGLHRDPGHWNLDPKYIQRRRSVFWEIMCLDKFKSLGSGRPSIFRMGEVDCEFPEDKEAFTDADGKQRDGLRRWRYGFIKDAIGPVSEELCLAKPIKYSEILDFDRRIREYENALAPPDISNQGPPGIMKVFMLSMQKELALLIIHRNFFARAMIRDPGNPLRSPFAPSFLCAYSTSIKISRGVRMYFEQSPGIMLRLWPLWAHVLTSAVIIGSVASNVNQLTLANAAFHELGFIVKLFKEASSQQFARRGLPIILKLHERARVALANKANEAGIPLGMTNPKVEQDETEELNILHGSARLIHRRGGHHPGSCSPSHGSSSEGNRTPDSSASSKAPSASQAQQLASTDVSPVNRQITPDRMIFSSENATATADTISNAFSTIPTQFPNQPSAQSLEQDIASLFSMFANPVGGATTNMMQSSPDVFDQQPAPFPQASYPFNTSMPQNMANNLNQWDFEAAQLESMLSATYGDTRLEAIPTETPSYNTMWYTNSGRGGPAEFSGGAVQFVEDWRLQEAIDPFLTEPGGDARMSI